MLVSINCMGNMHHRWVINSTNEIENIDQILNTIEESENPGGITNPENKVIHIKVYPNLSDQQEILTINFPAVQKIEQVLLYDRLGRIAQPEIFCASTNAIHIDSRSSGIYFLKVISNRHTCVFKVIEILFSHVTILCNEAVLSEL